MKTPHKTPKTDFAVPTSSENAKHFIERKKEIILKELETAHSWSQHIDSQISTWRNLAVTLLLAYTGFLFTTQSKSQAAAIPILIIPIPFLVLEIYRRIHLSLLSKNIIEIEGLFMIEDENEFAKQVRTHILRNHKILSFMRLQFFKQLIGYFLFGFFELDALVWYASIIVVALIAYKYFAP